MSDEIEAVCELGSQAANAIGSAGSAAGNAVRSVCQATSNAVSSVNFGAAAETARNLGSRVGNCITSLREAASCGRNLSGVGTSVLDGAAGAAQEAGRTAANGAGAAAEATANAARETGRTLASGAAAAGEATANAAASAGQTLGEADVDDISVGSSGSFELGSASSFGTSGFYFYGTGPEFTHGGGHAHDNHRRDRETETPAGDISQSKENLNNMNPNQIVEDIEGELGKEIDNKQKTLVTTKLNLLKSSVQGISSDLEEELFQNNMNQFSKQHRKNLKTATEAMQVIDSIKGPEGEKASKTEAGQNLKNQLSGYARQVNNTVMSKFDQHAREGNSYTMSKMSYCFGDEVGRDHMQERANEHKQNLGKTKSAKVNMFKANNKLFKAASSAGKDIKGVCKGDKRCFDSLRKKLPSLKSATKNFRNEASRHSGQAVRKSERARRETHAEKLTRSRNYKTRQGEVGI